MRSTSSVGSASSDRSYSRLFSRICTDVIGRKGRDTQATAVLTRLPQGIAAVHCRAQRGVVHRLDVAAQADARDRQAKLLAQVPGDGLTVTRDDLRPHAERKHLPVGIARRHRGRVDAGRLATWAVAPARWQVVHRRSTSSGTPLTTSMRLPSRSTATDTRRRTKSKASSSMRRQPTEASVACTRMASSSGLLTPDAKRLLMHAQPKAARSGAPSASASRRTGACRGRTRSARARAAGPARPARAPCSRQWRIPAPAPDPTPRCCP